MGEILSEWSTQVSEVSSFQIGDGVLIKNPGDPHKEKKAGLSNEEILSKHQ